MSGSIFSMFSEPESKERETIESVSFNDEKIFVVSIGGSIIAGEKPKTHVIAGLSASISKLHKKGFKFVLVVGGGKTGRNYISAAKTLGANNYQQDELGISVSRLNALLLIQAIEEAHPKVLTHPRQALPVLAGNKIPVFGGLLPSLTTDGVAALIAESLNAEFVNLTNVDGIYNKDPSKYSSARLYLKMTPLQLLKLISSQAKSRPGQNIVLDLPAAVIIKRSEIRTFILNGKNLENFEDTIEGRPFKGTLIQKKEETEL